ncbi:MAG TPA: RNA polymerase sigma factor [Vicinamibacterales bacterium]|nr:RNA polymerase sigma factor [Vicinamibacterales bacterium]
MALSPGPDDARTDGALVEATGRGDNEAFAVLVRRYVRPATLLAAQLLGVRDEAEDIVQDALLIVHRDARRFDATRPFAPWFYAIVRRLAANRRSRSLRRARLLRLWRGRVTGEPASPPAEAALNAGLDASTAARAMRTLSPMQRACFELVEIRGLSCEEVAAMHGISESTVRQHVFRARASLRSVLSDKASEGSE